MVESEAAVDLQFETSFRVRTVRSLASPRYPCKPSNDVIPKILHRSHHRFTHLGPCSLQRETTSVWRLRQIVKPSRNLGLVTIGKRQLEQKLHVLLTKPAIILPSAVKETNSFICPRKRPERSFKASRLDLINNRLRQGLPIKFLHSRMKIIGHNRRWIQTGFQSVNQCFTNLFAHPRLFGLFKNPNELCNSTLPVIRAYPIQESLRPNGRRLQVVTFARKSIRKRILQFHIIIITVFTRHLTCLDTLTRNFRLFVHDCGWISAA